VNFLLPTLTLWQRELVRFFRQPSRVAGALGSPIVFWLLIGTGLSSSFRLPGGPQEVSFLRYFYPGTVALILLFAAIFSTISVIEDRNEGFLQGVLVAPVPRAALVAGKVLGGATLAWLQGAAFLALAPLAGIPLTWGRAAAAAGVMALLSLALTAIGFALAWKVDSTQGFHAVMNLVLVPLWLLSGAFFPATGGPLWLQWVMRANPLTYGVAGLRAAIEPAGLPEGLPSPAACAAIVAATALAAFAADVAVVVRGRRIRR
jgi:ABC-2 type transport system permease protein